MRVRVTRNGHPHYVSVDTQAMQIAITGQASTTVVMGLTALSKNCTANQYAITCTLTLNLQACPSTAACYSADATAYDQYDASTNTIPPGADILSVEQGVAFTVATGAANTVGFTLSAVPNRIQLVPADLTSSIIEATPNPIVSMIGQGSHPFYVRALDYDGNIITGPGAPGIAVVASPAPGAILAVPAYGSRRMSITSVGHAAIYSTTVAMTITLSFPSGVTDGCAQTGANCTLTYTVDMPAPITIYTAGIATLGNPVGIAAGPDGNLWFTHTGANKIGSISTTGTVNEYSTGISPGAGLSYIARGPDNNLWFTECLGNRVGSITTSGTVVEYSAGISPSAMPLGIAAGPDNRLWFTERGGNRIGAITTSGTVSEYSSGITAGLSPLRIATGPDGNMWFTQSSAISANIGQITTGGTITEFAAGIGAGPFGITAGPDGNLWYALEGNTTGPSAIGQITTAGTATSFTNLVGNGTRPMGIALGPDGNLWFTKNNGGAIGRITTGGTVTNFPFSGAGPIDITAGPDGNMWFTILSPPGIGVITL